MKKIFWALVIIAAGFLAYRFLYDKWIVAPTPSTNQNQDGSPSAAGLREYSSEELGFSFKYPASWILNEAGRGVVILKPNENISDGEAPISLDASGEVPFEESAAEMSQNVIGGDRQEVRVGGLSGMRFAGSLKPELGEPADTYFVFTMLDRAGRLFSIDYRETPTSDKTNRSVYEAIVGSLRFIDRASNL